MPASLQSLFSLRKRSLDYMPAVVSPDAVPAKTVLQPCLSVIAGRSRRSTRRSFAMTDLTGKTALVTGASRGIGRAIALALGRAGAQVLVHYSSNEAAADATVDGIIAGGGHAQKIAADLRAADGPSMLAQRVRSIVGGRLDVLVANAGIARAASIEDTT